MRRITRPSIVVVTDRIGDGLTNGSQLFAHALTERLERWFDLTVIARAGSDGAAANIGRTLLVPDEVGGGAMPQWLDRHLDPPPGALVYNLGGTAFSSATAVALHTLHPQLPLVNHFQVNLRRYAEVEGREPEEGEALDAIQRAAAGGAARNLFVSFSELHLAIASGWPGALGAGYVVPNAFVDAGAPVQRAPSRDFTIVAAGRFSDYVKGSDLLLRAFGGLHRRHPAVRLRVASDDDDFADSVAPELRGGICLLGWLDREALHAAMRDADVVVVPSRYEPFGLVALEAMAMGTPVIAMAVGGLAEIVHDGRTGWLTPEDDGSLGLQLAMEDALSSRTRTRRMGRQAMLVARRSFHVDGVAEVVRRHLDHVRQASSWHSRADGLLTHLERGP